MTSLTLELKELPPGRLDLRNLVTDRILGMEAEQIGGIVIEHQSRPRRLDDLFMIRDGLRDRLILAGDLSRCDRVACDMRDGLLVVNGSVGHYLASGMRGGRALIRGNAGDFACSSQASGHVEIGGNVGDFCAAATPGKRRGMRGGCLWVRGNAGKFLGTRMRRGTVLIDGAVAPAAASWLIGGSIVCRGPIEAPCGIGMKRGTLLSLWSEPPPLHPGFSPAEPLRLSYLYLLLDSLRRNLPDVSIETIAHQLWFRSLGDRASGGVGELLWLHRD